MFFDTFCRRFFAHISVHMDNNSCWLWTGKTEKNGYARAMIDGTRKLVHRIAWELFVGPIAGGMDICHKCDTPRCIRPSHLFEGTHRDNILDAVKKGRVIPPVRPRKISLEIAEQIREDLREGLSLNRTAIKHGVSKRLILFIKQRKIWITNVSLTPSP